MHEAPFLFAVSFPGTEPGLVAVLTLEPDTKDGDSSSLQAVLTGHDFPTYVNIMFSSSTHNARTLSSTYFQYKQWDSRMKVIKMCIYNKMDWVSWSGNVTNNTMMNILLVGKSIKRKTTQCLLSGCVWLLIFTQLDGAGKMSSNNASIKYLC